MIPIFQKKAHGRVGVHIDQFRQEFSGICENHLATNRAKAFAFIFYDLTDKAIEAVLNDDKAFAELDELAGNDLSVFFFHAMSQRSTDAFNTEFLSRLGFSAPVSLPCVVFFKLKDGQFSDITIAELDVNRLTALHALYQSMAEYIKTGDLNPALGRWRRGAKFVASQLFGVAITKLIEVLF